MPSVTTEITRLQSILQDISVHLTPPLAIHHDNPSATLVAHNPMLEQTKQIKVDCHFVWKKLSSLNMDTIPHVYLNDVCLNDQTIDLFAKAMTFKHHQFLIERLFATDTQQS
ncbi:hypothetical protein AMTR_s00160p00022010 [Amborella trichopoda]|uniref:Reverse transcriptase Ty1/copia-type domain-containing protein n=1 Tax=Amborella trichopoda TaxID=13333 RepID=W1PTD7_AMBTC|nr:hypothetical protein AMTR_s00160p00022010 [Amborella trichopoda]